MPAVCLINRKGGVGKTTLTLALADFLSAIHGYHVLVIDVDPQASASIMLLGEDGWKVMEDARLTVADLFEGATIQSDPSKSLDAGQLIRAAHRVKGGASGQVHVVASSPRLQGIEERAMESLASWGPYVGSPYMILHQTLSRVMSPYHYVLIDCPPSIGMITLNALTMSSGYIIPTIPDYVSTVGLTQVTERVNEHAKGLRRRIPLHGTVVNRFKVSARLHSAILEELRGRPEAQPLWNTIIPDTVAAEVALNQTAGLMTLKARYGGGSHALYTSFEALAVEFLQRVS